MIEPTSITITREVIESAASLARECSSAVTRERVLVSQAAALAIRQYLDDAGLQTLDGRSSSSKYVDLLDICDFEVNKWRIEVRAVTRVQESGLYVPTMPLMVGVLSDFYISAQVDTSLRQLDLFGYANQESLGAAEPTTNGLFAFVPTEDLRPFDDLIRAVSSPKTSDPEARRSFEEWQQRASRIIRGLSDLLAAEGVFSEDQVQRLGAGLRDEVVRIWGERLPATGLESLFERLFRRFGIPKPVPRPPGEETVFANRASDEAEAAKAETQSAFFRDQLGVDERVSLYRHLLDNEHAVNKHRQMKWVLDRATRGKHQTTPRRRARIQAERKRKAESRWLEETETGRDTPYGEGPDLEPPPPFREPPDFTHLYQQPFGISAFVADPSSIYGPKIDFSADAEVVRLVAEAERLSYGHLVNPAFATEISVIDPLPHQRIAVYEHMLKQTRLRFLLADDAGAGKTIMTGLYIREMLARRLIKRVLIVPPAGLVGNWEREMHKLFSLQFLVATGADARSFNPFAGSESNLLIVSVDTLAADRMFGRLQEPGVAPYDLVVFDEAHKLSADREQDFSVRKTDRYRLAETLAGADSGDQRWKLEWSAHHLLLLTATPHMGKQFPYYCLWRLLEPDVLSTETAFENYPREARGRHFIRRSKEEMVRFDGTAIYPTRTSDTQSYDLTKGEISEQQLYDETTDYIQYYYNRASLLNRSAARLAMSVFQRRLASSTFALLRSFERRVQRLDGFIEDIKSGKITIDVLQSRQRQIDRAKDIYEEKTADEETTDDGLEENERNEEQAMGGVVATSLAELETERVRVQGLLDLARKVHDDPRHEESKFAKLRDLFDNPKYRDEKLIIFTEHKDTLLFLVRRLEGLGYTGQVAQIHGGMDYKDRDKMVEFFRRKISDGGARFLIATDAAGEGINLQFCWLMVNYDIPWNPARLEQRMGRIHRYGQEHDPVIIINLVAGSTREGRVMKTLLDKLERIRREMGSDKVFDVIGRLFEGVSLRDYLEKSAMNADGEKEATQQIEYKLTKEQVEALKERERKLLGEGGDVRRELPRLRQNAELELYRRMLPGYIRRFVDKASPLLGLRVEGDFETFFSINAAHTGSLDPLLPWLESYSETQMEHLTLHRPRDPDEAIWLHPGEPLFDAIREYFLVKYGPEALRGGVFVDPDAKEPYIFHLALISVERQPEPTLEPLNRGAVLETRLVGLCLTESGEVEECPVEHLLLLRSQAQNGAAGVPLATRHFVATAESSRESARAFAVETVARALAEKWKDSQVSTLSERETFIQRGYDYQDAELASRRRLYKQKAVAGDARAKGEMTKIRERQKRLTARRAEALAVLHREPELIAPGEAVFIAHALVIPSTDPRDLKRRDDEIEKIAMQVARAYEEGTFGARVTDVSTPAFAVAAGLGERPGFDLESRRPGEEPRAIEVKGRARIGDIDVTENEWIKACNLRNRYWLYVVYDCASPHPRLVRVQDPFGNLIVKAKGGVSINQGEVLAAAEQE